MQTISPSQFKIGLLRNIHLSMLRWFACNSPFQTLRVAMYRKAGVSIGKPRMFGGHVWIDLWAPVKIEENVLLGGYTFILTHSWIGNAKVAPVTIKRNVEIGVRTIIMPGITVGENATVGAGSIVTRNVAADTVVAGNPARLIRTKEKTKGV